MADEALTWGWMHWVGLASWPEIIAWADGWIMQLEQWPNELTEISLYARARDADMSQALRDLSRAGRPEEAAKLLVGRMLARLDAGDNPHELIYRLCQLSQTKFERPYVFLPDNLSDAIYALELHSESIDPEYGWLKRDAATDTLWLRQEAYRILSGLI
ncbi:hypothetical protein SU48_01725 [Deinococcus puniceus]|uniref:Uncharacterized protein n=1 Tax=Deinococcus puniceus TaxID=1182568 RepID=A0A172T6L7_9DEIO|nr:hypothetical protein SU48_01725 [Deinococcus puniceus]